MAESAKRVEIVMRWWTAITVYALLSATPAFSAGGGAIAWDRDTGKYGASWNQSTPKQATEAAISQCGASGCKVVSKVRPMMCGALATSGDSKKGRCRYAEGSRYSPYCRPHILPEE